MLPDRVSNPGPLTYESGALPIALRGVLKILRKRGEIAPYEHFLLLSTILCYLLLDFYVKRRTIFSLRDKQLFEITESELTRVNCIFILMVNGYTFRTSYSAFSFDAFFFKGRLVVLLFYVHGKHLMSCRDDQLT